MNKTSNPEPNKTTEVRPAARKTASSTLLNKPKDQPIFEPHVVTTSPEDPFINELMEAPAEELIFETDQLEETNKSDTISPSDTQKIVTFLAQRYNTTKHTTLADIAKLIQDGGTNATKKQLVRTINGIVFDMNDLRSVIQFHVKTSTVRKLAKSLRSSITKLSLDNNWAGPLVRDLQRLEPQLQIGPGYSVYCYKIHTDNYAPEVPVKIREALQRREQKILDQNRQQAPNKKTKGKKGKKGQ
jgi:hypothetical protein